MAVRDTIEQIITRIKPAADPVTDDTNLYSDLCLDSLAFVRLLMEIETEYQIRFSIMEKESCLLVGRLIELVESRLKERGDIQ